MLKNLFSINQLGYGIIYLSQLEIQSFLVHLKDGTKNIYLVQLNICTSTYLLCSYCNRNHLQHCAIIFSTIPITGHSPSDNILSDMSIQNRILHHYLNFSLKCIQGLFPLNRSWYIYHRTWIFFILFIVVYSVCIQYLCVLFAGFLRRLRRTI